jgi:hypothetical protein
LRVEKGIGSQEPQERLKIMETTAKKSCPGEEMIADYLEGRLSAEDKEATDAHLSECELCLEELVIAGEAIRDAAEAPAVPLGVTEATVRLVAKQTTGVAGKGLKESIAAYMEKISDYFRYSLPWRWQQATIRSSKIETSPDLVMIKKVFKEIEAEIEIEKTGEDKAHIRVKAGGREKNGIRVTLKKGEREVSSQLLGGGYALFEDIPFGRYEIVFSTNGSELGIYTFEIRESRHG